MSSKKKLLILSAAGLLIVVLGVVIGLLWPRPPEGGPDRAALLFPEDTIALAWTAPAGDVLAFLERVGVTSPLLARIDREYADTRERLGFDPLHAGDLEVQGFDLGQPIALGLVPARESGAMALLVLPMREDVSAIDWVERTYGKLRPDHSHFETGTESGHPVLWLVMDGGQVKAGAIIDLQPGLAILLPVAFDASDADRISAEVEATARRLLASETPRLQDSQTYYVAVAGNAGAFAGAYVNVDKMREFLGNTPDFGLLASSLSNEVGIGIYLQAEERELRLVTRTVGREDDGPTYLRNRDTAVLDLIPGPPSLGIHFALDSKQFGAMLDQVLTQEQWAWMGYQKAWKEAMSSVGLPADTQLHQLWDGELGLFMTRLSAAPESWLDDGILFLGMADRGKAATAISGFVDWLSDGDAGEEEIGGSKAWHLQRGERGVWFLVHEGRLWISGRRNTLAAIVEKQAGGLIADERSRRLTQVATEPGGAAFYLDLQQFMAQVPESLSPRRQRSLEAWQGLLTGLDSLTYREAADGKISTGTLTLSSAEQPIAELLVTTAKEKLEAQLEKEGRKAKVGEARDMLERIALGAGLYYTTPRLSETGKPLPCRFPDSVPATPGPSCCRAHGGPDENDDGRCDLLSEPWSHPVWEALRVLPVEDHYCVYSFDSNGRSGWEAEYTATAHCDLDCDGVRSTFQRYGKGDPGAPEGQCNVRGASALFIDKELE